jgi:hypothetical protein
MDRVQQMVIPVTRVINRITLPKYVVASKINTQVSAFTLIVAKSDFFTEQTDSASFMLYEYSSSELSKLA